MPTFTVVGIGKKGIPTGCGVVNVTPPCAPFCSFDLEPRRQWTGPFQMLEIDEHLVCNWLESSSERVCRIAIQPKSASKVPHVNGFMRQSRDP